ncbi:MAG: hypothetical protein GY780_14200 [bacterium]|nr:hypothetical protein [bacterium]
MKNPLKLIILFSCLLLVTLWGCSSSDDPTDPGGGNPPPNEGSTALVGDDGNETTDFDSFEQVSLSLTDLDPLTSYTVEVNDNSKAVIGLYELVTDQYGQIDASSVLYDPEPGTYSVTVLETSISFDITVNEPTGLNFTPCDDQGDHLNNLDTGQGLFLKATGGTADATFHVYIAPNRYDWTEGMYLYDYSESIDELSFDGDGNLDVTNIWNSVNNIESAAFDIVIDMNMNGIYDSGDLLDGQIGVGFVVQETVPDKSIIDGHVVERLSSDSGYVYRDLYSVDENVYVYVNPVAKMQNLGGDRYVKWFIVPHQETWNDGDPLNPVTTPLGDTVQYGCTNAGRRLVWPAPLTPGQYDVVIDVNADGVYDKGQDFLDGYSGLGAWVGFTVQDEPETREWTVLVYADGEGGLSGTRSQYAQEIADNMNSNMYAGVLFDGDNSAGYADCKRYVCTPGQVIEDASYEEINMGHPLTLQDFLTWGIAKFPAEKYMVVLSNHGGSWFGEGHPVPNELWYEEGEKAMCYDNGDALNMYELEAVYRDLKSMVGDKLDVVWYQGCLMGAIEVAAISKDYFDFMVSHETVRFGSENTNKFPNVIQHMRGGPSAESMSNNCVTAESAPNSSLGVNHDLAHYDSVESAVKQFVDATVDHADFEDFRGNLITAMADVRRVAPPGTSGELEPYVQNCDMAHLFTLISESTDESIPATVREAANNVVVALAPLVELTMGNTGGLEGLNGTAIWLPRTAAEYNNFASEYSGFDFTSQTRWLSFLSNLWGVAYRIELTWGAQPSDLDSHLWDAQEPANHVWYSCHTCIPGASLDLDDTNGYGPENIRIEVLNDGPRDQYDYWVRRYSGSPGSEISTVKVFVGGSAAPAKTYFRSWADAQRGWHVFSIMTDTRTIIDVDEATPDVPSSRMEPGRK